MDWQTLLGWSGPALDLAGLAALGAVFWQLRRDPAAAWRDYEARLRELQESLRLLVLQAEGEARELDRRLAAHADELRALRGDAVPADAQRVAAAGDPDRRSAATAGPAPAAPATRSSPGATTAAPPALSLAERVQQLAAAHTPIAEIARRLSLPVAEARVLAGLTTGGLALCAAASGARGAAAAEATGPGRRTSGVAS